MGLWVQEEGASSFVFFKCFPPRCVSDCLVLCHCEVCLPSVLVCVLITSHKDSSQDGWEPIQMPACSFNHLYKHSFHTVTEVLEVSASRNFQRTQDSPEKCLLPRHICATQTCRKTWWRLSVFLKSVPLQLPHKQWVSAGVPWTLQLGGQKQWKEAVSALYSLIQTYLLIYFSWGIGIYFSTGWYKMKGLYKHY